jgi:hexosaminidase
MFDIPLLLPVPRHIDVKSHPEPLSKNARIVILSADLLFEAQTAQTTLKQMTRREWSIVVGASANPNDLFLGIDASLPAQGYTLNHAATQRFEIHGSDVTGIYYGVLTLLQLLQHYGAALPQLEIRDYPDFAVRGVMLDVSRDRVITMATLYDLIDLLSSWKMNQLQLYMEHSFAYSQHETIWKEASPFTGQQILEIDAYCKKRHIELVPNQNSFGHLERWLKHPEYKHLAECPDGFIGDFGDHMGERRPATSLNPLAPASIDLITGLYDELLPHFSSSLLNVGGDEPWEMGQCASKAACAERGRGRVYVDYLLKLYEQAHKRGKRMMFWADVINKYPELLSEIPRDVIALEWGYYEGHPYSEHAPMFEQSGLEFYVCPGTSGWNTIAGRTDNAIGNIRDAVKTGLAHGATGVLMTDWGDRGHWQPLPISYLGYVYGMGMAWCAAANEMMALPDVLNRFVFRDDGGVMGQLVYDLGNIYKLEGLAYPNGSLLFFLLQLHESDLSAFINNLDTHVVTNQFFGIKAAAMRQGLALLAELRAKLDDATMQRPDAELVIAEFRLVIDLLAHACKRGLILVGEGDWSYPELLAELEALIPQQRLNWLARSRPGGLKDSLLRFEPVLRSYRNHIGATPSYL